MVFSTLVFLTIFLPLVLAGSWSLALILRKCNIRPWPVVNALLLLSSLIFYFWGEGWGVLWLCASILVNYFLACAITWSSGQTTRKVLLGADIAANLCFLGYFKYAAFGVRSLNALADIGVPVPEIALPLGISFYTFQAMSYVVDVYRGEVKPAHGILDFACYITMFPQLVAGPIVRYVDIEKNLADRTTDFSRIASGMRRFLIGLIKKVVIANSVAEFADKAWGYVDGGSGLPPGLAWLAVIAYSIQIYYDFSGYSDMAIGIGRMLGFDFLENFRYPYIADSVRDFWRRWHISLSSWFRDYLYIPLGGNRKGLFRTCINSLIVFALCGLWHGASEMFIFWGLWHGLFLMAERLVAYFRKEPSREGCIFTSILGHAYTCAVFISGWIVFRSETPGVAWRVFRSLFGLESVAPQTNILYIDASPKVLVAVILGIVFSLPVVPALRGFIERKMPLAGNAVSWVVITVAALFAILLVAGGSYNPFIYFRF